MSRIGKKPIVIPKGVTLEIHGEHVACTGPKGRLRLKVHPRMKLCFDQNVLSVSRPTETALDRSLHGLTRTLLHNMVSGVVEEYSKSLDIEGIGFRADLKGKTLHLHLGFSHPIEYEIPEGITAEVVKQTRVIVKGSDKALVGQTAANIRRFYKPEPYKGKGIRYTDEVIRRKAGKAAGS